MNFRLLWNIGFALLLSVLVVAGAPAQTPSQHALTQVYRSQANSEEIEVASARLAEALEEGSLPSPGRVVVIYFTPNDRKPAADHYARIRRIVEENSSFYTQELARHGFPNRQMNVLRNSNGEVEVIDVVGAGPDKEYGKPDGHKIRDEAKVVLRKKEIDPDRCVQLIFCNLMDYDPKQGTISHHSPYYGSGNHVRGTAWQCDSEILDPRRLTDMTPITDGEYGRITIGRHNSIFIGGVIHELGHALSLPHGRERQDESDRGKAIMGSGNQRYGEQLRGEGAGAFLTQAHAMRLAGHCVFNARSPASLFDLPQVDWQDLKVNASQDNQLCVTGTVAASVPIHAVVAYFDPAGGSDYDATTASAVPDQAGRFSLCSERLKAGISGQLRIVACHVNGATTTRQFSFQSDKQGRLDLSAIQLALGLGPMVEAIRKDQLATAEAELKRISLQDPSLQEIGQRVLDRFQSDWRPSFRRHPAPGKASSEGVRSIPLSHLPAVSAKVGWLRPAYDCVPGAERILSIQGDYFAHGIYAHAPAQHEYQLDGQWTRLEGRCGMQTGFDGTVDFAILGDNKVLWRKRKVTDGDHIRFDVDLQGVKLLTLSVTDGGDGNGSDWGVWIEPKLIAKSTPSGG